MNEDFWIDVWDLYQRASSLPPAERSEFIWENCPDPVVRAEAEALLAGQSVDISSLRSSTALAPAWIEAGARVGRYTITGLLGRGAMGDTFRAHDDVLDRPVALKVLRSWPGQAEVSQRSIREARAASALNHPNIVTVFEVLQLDSGAAIVMELIEGRTLRHWCGEAQPLANVVSFGRQLASALDAAHAQGTIHRDVKPENVMVRGDGLVKLLDFGLAARQTGTGPSSVNGAGTIRYMSPEQAYGLRLTPATDVFSLGIILFELATGQHPYRGESDAETLFKISSGKRSDWPDVNPEVPVTVRNLVSRMLAKNPEERPKASEVASRLMDLANPPPVAARKSSWPWVAALLAVMVIGLIGLITFGRNPVMARQKSKDLPNFHKFTDFTEEQYITSAAISPDGQKMIFMDVDGVVRLRDVRGQGDRILTRLPNTKPDQMNWIAQTGKVLLNSLDLSQDSYAFHLSILDTKSGSQSILPVSGKRARPSFDGRRLAYLSADRSEVWVSDIDGSQARRLVVSRPGALNWVEWSTDGRQLHYFGAEQALGNTGQWRGTIWRTIDPETGALVGEQPTERLWPGFMQATGRLLLLREGLYLSEVSFDKRGHFLKPVEPLSNQPVVGALSASDDGSRVAAIDFARGEWMIYVADTQPGKTLVKNRRRLTGEVSNQVPQAWTPDNQGVIFESRSARDGHRQIYVQLLEAKLPQLLSPSEEDQVLPSVSPDGRWVLFLSGSTRPKRELSLRRAPIGGGESHLVPTGGPVLDFACLYRAKRCVIREIQNSQAVFFELDPIRGKGRELTRVAITNWLPGDWSLSPDGKMVVFSDVARTPTVLRVIYLDQPPLEKSISVQGPAPMGRAVWTSAGDGWYVPTQDYLLRLVDWDGRNRYVHDIGDFAIPSGDGKKLAFLDHPRDQNVWILER